MNVLLVTEAQGYLLLSLQKMLKAKNCETIVVRPEISEISKIKLPIKAILIFADEKLLKQQQALVYIKDKALEEDIAIFAIGASEELKKIKELKYI